jgi:hypothetical protein
MKRNIYHVMSFSSHVLAQCSHVSCFAMPIGVIGPSNHTKKHKRGRLCILDGFVSDLPSLDGMVRLSSLTQERA